MHFVELQIQQNSKRHYKCRLAGVTFLIAHAERQLQCRLAGGILIDEATIHRSKFFGLRPMILSGIADMHEALFLIKNETRICI